MGLLILPGLLLLTILTKWAAAALSSWWLLAMVPCALLLALGLWDVLQRKHSVLRNYPVFGHLPHELTPAMVYRRVGQRTVRSYEEIYDWLEPGELLAEPPPDWAADWRDADPDTFSLSSSRVFASRRYV
jgi:hypothetical protein